MTNITGRTMSMNGPAIFMRCRKCHKLMAVNTIVVSPDFIEDKVQVRIPTSVICSPCRREEGKENA